MPKTAFDVTKHAYAFSNQFVNQVQFLGVTVTTSGRCGGMSYAALDHFHANEAAPVMNFLPPNDSRVAGYIWMRQTTSLINTLGKFAEIIAFTPNRQLWWDYVAKGSVNVMSAIRGEIDHGRPVNLGLVARDAGVSNTGVNHQVLAIGYRQGSEAYDFEVTIYDPNHPSVERVLKPHSGGIYFVTTGSTGKDEEWGTFFADLGYSKLAPPKDEPVPTQDQWRWCHRCQGMHFTGNKNSAGAPLMGPCPAGGVHSTSGSGHYLIPHGAGTGYELPEYGQPSWSWCRYCQGLHYTGQQGHCPAGSGQLHSTVGSGAYTLIHNSPSPTGQPNWRWCAKCSGLVFGGNADAGACPGGGLHYTKNSGNYSVWQK